MFPEEKCAPEEWTNSNLWSTGYLFQVNANHWDPIDLVCLLECRLCGSRDKWTRCTYGNLVVVQSLSPVRLFATPWTIAHQIPLPMGFPRQDFWSGVPFPSPEDFPNRGIKPSLLHYGKFIWRLFSVQTETAEMDCQPQGESLDWLPKAWSVTMVCRVKKKTPELLPFKIAVKKQYHLLNKKIRIVITIKYLKGVCLVVFTDIPTESTQPIT